MNKIYPYSILRKGGGLKMPLPPPYNLENCCIKFTISCMCISRGYKLHIKE